MSAETNEVKKPSLLVALIPVVFMIVALIIGIAVYGADPHIPLFFSGVVAAAIALLLGNSWKTIESGMINGISLALQAIIILVIIGMIIGSWLAGGIVPTMIYYGLDILSPTYFLFASCIISGLVAIAAGNAWTAAGTIGIALMGVGEGLGLNTAMVAGSVISGIYFGDKISPFSETTNLAPGVAGSELFEHIKHMLFTTVPALIISLILYFVLGFVTNHDNSNLEQVSTLQNQLSDLFTIGPLLLIVPAVVIIMMIKKMPAIPALSTGAILGTVTAVLVQGLPMKEAISTLYYGYSADTGVDVLDNLLNNGGIEAMMFTVSLIIIAMSFGGIMESTGFFQTIVESLLSLARSAGSLIGITVGTSFFANVVGSEQYLSIIIPARMYANAYDKKGLKMKNLSRTVEDAGTMTSPLVPWNTCGAFMTATLGVSTLSYAPFAFLCLLSPLMAIIYGFTGFSVEYKDGHKKVSNMKAAKKTSV
ncbi:Na+/H+ antiporter NhaC [Lentibacillus halophilus]|uniref:Na+/H+ antiporter NhaC n=1 Tax=Lentibacillus halophilus TaxID=295065 RepID=A0ABN0Z190_9BACI